MFHDDHEAVRPLEIIYKAYDPVDVPGLTQENHFEGYGLAVHVLVPVVDLIPGYLLYNDREVV